MRGWIATLGLVLWPWLAWSQDVPADFRGAQFIDASGCVFARDGNRWTARLDRDGQQICGFPPTEIADSGDDQAHQSVEERLQATLAEGLRDGDLKVDRRQPELRKEPMADP